MTYLIVGLGNPGPKYANTRHNAGHHVIGELLERCDATLSRHRSGALVAEVRLGMGAGGVPGPRAILAIPNSFMNVSGITTAKLLRFYNADASDLIVIHDELDLPEFHLKLKTGGGEGGHNGLKSISQQLGTRNYHRLRFGIGRPPASQDPAAFVLGQIPQSKRTDWAVTIGQAADALTDCAERGVLAAQMSLHSR